MKWEKRGLIFAPSARSEWMHSHASLPIADRRGDGLLRIYFGTRDRSGRSHIGHVDVSAGNIGEVVAVAQEPLLPLGRLGAFDDSGIMPSSLVDHGGRKFLFYIGWTPQVTVPYRLAIGLAVSDDGGETFRKHSEGPIADRSVDEPFFNTAPCVLVENGLWRMWYVSTTEWEVRDGHPEPRYQVRYAESSDGLEWRRTDVICIGYDDFTGAIGRPFVYRHRNGYRMLYSYRSAHGYRSDPALSYRLGFAESVDGLRWTRRDDAVGIERSESGWDSEMIEYCSLLDNGGETIMLYNGNGFGRTGFGYAALVEA